MSKKLTEKYQNKELSGWYYVKTNDGHICHWLLFTDTIEFEKDIKEVVAAVPSYDEYKEMDNELKELACKNNSLAMECGKLQEQLKEANQVILDMAKNNPVAGVYALDYKSKWGVK